MPDPRHVLGERAEEAVAAWLATRGWRILARRWRCPQGELDIVALDVAATLVAVEVKLRTSARAGGPLESVDPRRVHRLRAALARFRATDQVRASAGLRIDLVTVVPTPDGRWRLAHHVGIDAW